jgi:hypothetical protein
MFDYEVAAERCKDLQKWAFWISRMQGLSATFVLCIFLRVRSHLTESGRSARMWPVK